MSISYSYDAKFCMMSNTHDIGDPFHHNHHGPTALVAYSIPVSTATRSKLESATQGP